MNTTIAPKSFRAPLLVGVGLALMFSGLTTFAAERWAILEAIHSVENPRNVTRPGPYGELGAYQFREQTWRRYTTESFALALDRSVADEVAVKCYESIKQGLERAGVAVTPYTIALAWNGGLGAALRRRPLAAVRDYAQRVANLTEVFERQTLASAR